MRRCPARQGADAVKRRSGVTLPLNVGAHPDFHDCKWVMLQAYPLIVKSQDLPGEGKTLITAVADRMAPASPHGHGLSAEKALL